MQEPIVTLQLPLASVNAILNSLAQTGNNIQNTSQLVQQQAQAQLRPPPPPVEQAAVVPADNVKLFPGTPV